MKSCELCKEKARMYCESDQANLCWDCDAKVHSANFLVARHSRSLLCHLCQSPTPWSASGAVLAPTISVCEKCVKGSRGGEDDGDEEGEEEEVEEEEVVEENQIVPAPPPSSESSSNSGGVMVSRKRRLDNASNSSSDEDDQSSQLNVGTPPSDSSARRQAPPQAPTKIQRTSSFQMGRIGVSESGILESLRRFHREELGSGLEMAECCTSSEGPLAVDLSSCDSF